MIAWAAEALAASALLMLLVLGGRAVVRRWFGAEVAYLLWALPPSRLLLPTLPRGWGAATTPLAAANERITVLVLPTASPAPEAGGPPWLAIVWLGGAALFLVWQGAGYRRSRARILAGANDIARHGRVRVVASAAVQAPVAFGVLRPTIAVPHGWDARGAEERALALAHEQAHHARGDLLANWVALLVLALHWFDPVTWRAYRVFRADQEQATDARVLRATGVSPRAYARCLVAATAGPWLSPACHLTTLTDLKRRLYMLTRPLPTRRRARVGVMTTAAAGLVGLALTASGGSALAKARAASIDVAPVPPVPPVPFAPALLPAPPQVADAPTPPVPPIPPAPGQGARQVRTIIVRRDAASAPTLLIEHGSVPLGRPLPAGAALPTNFTIPGECKAAPASGAPATHVIRGEAGEKSYTVICTPGAKLTAGGAPTNQPDAYRQALAGLRGERALVAAQPNLPDADRRDALGAIDTSIAELEADLAKAR